MRDREVGEREQQYRYLSDLSIFSISRMTKGERNSGRVLEDGDRTSGCSAFSEDLHGAS